MVITYANVLLVAVLQYVFFRSIRVFLINTRRIRGKWVAPIFMILELTAWITFFFISVDKIFSEKSYHDFLFVTWVIILVLLITWFLLKELVAGALFKIQFAPNIGKFLQIGEMAGTIQEIRGTYLTIESTDNKSVKIPYTKLQNSVIVLGDKKEKDGGDYRFRLVVANSWQEEEVTRKIMSYLLHSPYCAHRKAIKVKQVEDRPSNNVFEISFGLISASHYAKILREAQSLFS